MADDDLITRAEPRNLGGIHDKQTEDIRSGKPKTSGVVNLMQISVNGSTFAPLNLRMKRRNSKMHAATVKMISLS
jgi:hypothetical protein